MCGCPVLRQSPQCLQACQRVKLLTVAPHTGVRLNWTPRKLDESRAGEATSLPPLWLCLPVHPASTLAQGMAWGRGHQRLMMLCMTTTSIIQHRHAALDLIKHYYFITAENLTGTCRTGRQAALSRQGPTLSRGIYAWQVQPAKINAAHIMRMRVIRSLSPQYLVPVST